MNLFAVDWNPWLAAIALCDQHVSKMTPETAQILSTNATLRGHAALMKPTHLHHPVVQWVGKAKPNWFWAVHHGFALAEEFEFRFGHPHASLRVLKAVVHWGPDTGWYRTPFVQAMPEEYRARNAVFAYRHYYNAEKRRFARWNHDRPPPAWWEEP